MAQATRRSVGLLLTSELVRQGYELIDDRDSFIVRRRLSPEANLLVSVGPYETASPSGIQVDITLGLQYPQLQRLWNRLIEHQPEEPAASWSVMSAGAQKWCPDSERSTWFYPMQHDLGLGSTTRAILEALQRRGLPYCAGLEHVSALAPACARDAESLWSCDQSYLLPIVLCMAGKSGEAKQQAEAFLHRLEAAPRRPNPAYLHGYQRFVANISALA
jgi:hypothetical protein